ncbi:MAG TPA: ABC transporter permease, partial [Vicinamibacterales bacterium]|nr:ABC transporter permease [Vicinamibacterales bacterium]
MRLAADVAFGFRLLRRSPGFAITAIVTLSLGVGVNVAMFSIVRAVLIEDLPYPDAGRVVTISQRVERVVQHDLSYDDLLAVRAGAPALAHLSGFVGPRVTVRGEGAPEHVAAHRVLPEYFDVFGVAPAVGRVFGAADFAAAPAIVVISESIWRSQFNARADVLGRTIRVDRVPLTVVGVMPASFDGHAGTQNATGVWMLWMPAPSDRAPIVEAVARVAPGQTIEIAHAQIAAAMKPRQPEFLELAEGQRFRFEGMSVVPVGAVEADRVRPGVILLQALAGFLLLMTCANLANVFLAHGASRRRELGVRVALGVGRARLVGQLLTEAAVIAAIGGALGALVAAGIVPIAVALAGEILPRGPSIGVSAPELAVGLALAGITALVFAGVPAWLASGADPLAAMRGTSHTAGHGVRA